MDSDEAHTSSLHLGQDTRLIVSVSGRDEGYTVKVLDTSEILYIPQFTGQHLPTEVHSLLDVIMHPDLDTHTEGRVTDPCPGLTNLQCLVLSAKH